MRFLAQIIKVFRKNVRIMRTTTPLEWSPCQFIFLDGFLKKGVSEVPSRFKNKRQVIKKIACSALIGVSIILTLAVLGGTQPDIKRFFHLTSNSVYAADDQPANPQRPRATITGQDAVYTLGEFLRRSHMLGSLNKPLSLVVYRFHLRIKESGQFCLRSLSKRRGRWGYRNVMPDLTRSLQKRRLI